jgi:hypothetical protein
MYSKGNKTQQTALPNQPLQEISTNKLSSGVYFYQLRNKNGIIHSGKLIVVE